MDPLSEVVSLLRPRAAVAKPISGKGEWAVAYRAYDNPGFTVVLEGQAWLTVTGSEPIRLTKGDFLLFPTTPAFTLASKLGVIEQAVTPSASAIRHGEISGPPDFVALGGSFTYEHVNAPLLLSLLPRTIFVPEIEGRYTRLGGIVKMISEECTSENPGKELIVQRLLEVLLVEALRWRDVMDEEPLSVGLFAGLQDPAIARSLSAIHTDVRPNWTVAQLAQIAGMSRSAFSARFSQLIGCAPIEYITRWRIALAKDALERGDKSLDRIADEIGYHSASAFSTAFRKRLGCAPGRFQQQSSIKQNPDVSVV
jgi:AraC-like DNA-binding protein